MSWQEFRAMWSDFAQESYLAAPLDADNSAEHEITQPNDEFFAKSYSKTFTPSENNLMYHTLTGKNRDRWYVTVTSSLEII